MFTYINNINVSLLLKKTNFVLIRLGTFKLFICSVGFIVYSIQLLKVRYVNISTIPFT